MLFYVANKLDDASISSNLVSVWHRFGFDVEYIPGFMRLYQV